MDGISRSRGWDKEIPHGVLPMEQLVLGDKWARIPSPKVFGVLILEKNILKFFTIYGHGGHFGHVIRTS